MRRGYLDTAGSETDLNIIVRNNRYLSADYRKNERFSDQMLCSFVIGVYGNRRVTEHSLGTRRCDLNILAVFTVLYRIFYVPEESGLILVLNLCIRKCCCTVRTPVDYSVSAIYKSLVVKVYKGFFNCL